MNTRIRDAICRLALRTYVSAVLVFILLPLVTIAAMSFTPGEFLQFPPQGFSLRWYHELAASSQWMTALRNSLVVALGSAILATTIGGASAYALYRYDYRFGALLAGLTTVPTLLPPVILGVAFMTFFVSLGVVGQVSNLVVAHAVFVTPFPFVLISQGLDEVDRSYEEASRNLGASRLTTLRTITLPLVRANVFSGALFAFILSLNEYIIAWLVAGFAFKTIPIQIFTSLRYSYSPIIAAISVVFILATVAVMFGIDRLSGGIWE